MCVCVGNGQNGRILWPAVACVAATTAQRKYTATTAAATRKPSSNNRKAAPKIVKNVAKDFASVFKCSTQNKLRKGEGKQAEGQAERGVPAVTPHSWGRHTLRSGSGSGRIALQLQVAAKCGSLHADSCNCQRRLPAET